MDDQLVIAEAIKTKTLEHGFDCVGITGAKADHRWHERLTNFITNHFHGSMEWMVNRAEQRANPQKLWPQAQSIIMMGMNYGPDINPLDALQHQSNGTISVYAQNRDYHDLIKKKQKQIARWMVETYGGDVKVFVDTAPVMEKPLANKAGLGWQGKHTNLVSRDFGSWLFLGAIFTTLPLPDDPPTKNHCGQCQACLDICPTNAFPAPYQLDGRRCISYLTIEHKGIIPEEFREAIGNRIYGCDDCLAVCPWNKFAQQANETKLQGRRDRQSPKLANLLTLSDSQFREQFSGSPIKRIGRNRFIRNVLIAAGNSDDATLISYVKPLLNEDDDVIIQTAKWALERLQKQ